jgi:hypothetical protein
MSLGNSVRASWTVAALAATLLWVTGAGADAPPQSGVLVYDSAFFADQRPNTAYDMIGRLPGFTFTNTGSARGFAGNAGNVLIDGQRPTSKSDDLESILTRIPAADVERIELIRGGAPGIDMQGLTVIANVIRKKGSSTQWVLDATENIFQDGHAIPGLTLSFTEHDGDKTFEASASRYNGYDDSVGNGFHQVVTFNGNGTTTTTWNKAHTSGQGSGGGFTGAATLPLWGGTFKGNVALQDSPFYSTATYFDGPNTQYLIDDSVNRNAEVGLHWNGNLGPVQDESLILERLGFSKDVNSSSQPDNDAVFRSSSMTDETILRETLRYPFNDRFNVEGGGEFAYNSLKGDTSFVANTIVQPLPDAIAHVEEKRGEVFGQGSWKIMPTLLLEAGSRFEYSVISESSDNKETRSFFYPKPRAVLTWSATKDDQVRLRYEKVVGQLDFGNFVATGNLGGTGVTAGNSDLRPDQRTQYEISYEHHFWDKGAVVLQLIHEEITDVVDFVPVTASNGDQFDAPGNIGNGQNNQINLQVTLPLDKLGIPGGLIKTVSNFQLSSVPDPVTGLNRVISGERPQDIELNFTQDLNALKSTWGFGYYNCWDEHYFRLDQTQHRRVVPPFITAFWEYKPTPNWSFHFELDNLGRFIYDNEFFNYKDGSDRTDLTSTDLRSIHSQPRVFIEVRKTFN